MDKCKPYIKIKGKNKDENPFEGIYVVKSSTNKSIRIKKLDDARIDFHKPYLESRLNINTFNIVPYLLLGYEKDISKECLIEGEFNFDKVKGTIRKTGRFGKMYHIKYKIIK